MADYSALYRLAPFNVSAPSMDLYTPLAGIAGQFTANQELALRQKQLQDAAAQRDIQNQIEKSRLGISQQELAIRQATAKRAEEAAAKPELVDIFGPTGIKTTMQRSPSGELSQLPGQAQQTNAPDLTGEDFLKTLEPGKSALIKGIVEGRYPPPTTAALRSPQVQQTLQDLAQYEPGFDLTQWKARNQTRADFSSGKMGSNIRSFNTVIGHLGDFLDSAEKLDNTRFPVWNKIANAYIANKGDPRITNFNLKRQAVSDELAKAFRETGMSETEIQAWKSNFDSSFSPEQFKGAVSTAVGLLNSRINATVESYTRVMGKAPPNVLSSSAQKTLNKLGMQVTTDQGQQPQAPAETQPAGGIVRWERGPDGRPRQVQ